MERGKFEKVPPVMSGRKKLIVALCLVLLVTASISATMAYFHRSSDPVINTFHAGSVGAEIREEVEDNVKKVITVTNTGASPVYVRIQLVSYYERSEGVVDASKASPTVSFTLGENWVKDGDTYYYSVPLAAGATTTDLLNSDVPMEAGQVIEVLADTVQAAPAQAVKEAWGVEASTFLSE